MFFVLITTYSDNNTFDKENQYIFTEWSKIATEWLNNYKIMSVLFGVEQPQEQRPTKSKL